MIFTCNPEDYTGRSYHGILQDSPQVFVKAWSKTALLNTVIRPLLQQGTPLIKLGSLLEGGSGLGKSSLAVSVLTQAGYTHISPEALSRLPDASPHNPADKRYLQFTPAADIKEDEERLCQAFHRGYVVVLDELNLSPELETLLNQLLTGKDPKQHPARCTGFYVIASQNSTKQAGSRPLSAALRNRFHCITTSLTPADLAESATLALQQAGYPASPAQCSKLAHSKAHAPMINARPFFESLHTWAVEKTTQAKARAALLQVSFLHQADASSPRVVAVADADNKPTAAKPAEAKKVKK